MARRVARGAVRSCLALLLVAAAGCLDGPAAPQLQSGSQDPFGVVVEVQDGRVAWRTQGATTPLLRIDVLLAAAGDEGGGQAWQTLQDPGAAGAVGVRLPPGAWTVRARAVDGTGREALSPPVRIEVPAPAARPLPALRAEAPASVADADGNGSEAVQLVGQLTLASGQSLRAATWSQDGRVVAQGLAATVWRGAGRHAFTLEVTYDDGGALGTQRAQATVQVEPNRPPVAAVEPTPDRWDGDGDGAEPVRLRANASDPEGRPITQRWRSAGITLVQGPHGNVSAGLGTHTYTFEAVDDGGARTLVERRLTVHPNRPPTASAGPDRMAFDPEGDGASVALEGAAADPDGLPITVRWRLDGAAQDLATTPQAVVPLPRGTHVLRLTVRDAAGAEATDQAVVVVRAPLPPIAASLAATCDLLRCDFNAAGSSGEAPLALRWSLGDGNASTGAAVTHTYAAEGRFPVRLEVEDAVGRKATAWTNVTTRRSWNVFEDGAEAAGGWTHASWYHQTGFVPQPPDLGVANHPNGTWAATTAQARTGLRSWTAPYPDQINASMTSAPVRVPDDPGRAHALTYWLRGGVENNPNLGIDGLRVYVQLADGSLREEQYVTDDHPAWKPFTVPLDAYAGQTVRIVFSFQSDGFCSQGNGALGRALAAPLFACDASSYEGYFVDDIALF